MQVNNLESIICTSIAFAAGLYHGYQSAKFDEYVDTLNLPKKASFESCRGIGSGLIGAAPHFMLNNSVQPIDYIVGAVAAYVGQIIGQKIWHDKYDSLAIPSNNDLKNIESMFKRYKRLSADCSKKADKYFEKTIIGYIHNRLKETPNPRLQEYYNSRLVELERFDLAIETILSLRDDALLAPDVKDKTAMICVIQGSESYFTKINTLGEKSACYKKIGGLYDTAEEISTLDCPVIFIKSKKDHKVLENSGTSLYLAMQKNQNQCV